MKSGYKITFVNDEARIADNLARVWGEIISVSTPGKVTRIPKKQIFQAFNFQKAK